MTSLSFVSILFKGVPGFSAAMIRHLHSLRRMQRDHGWIHTLLVRNRTFTVFMLTLDFLGEKSAIYCIYAKPFTLLVRNRAFTVFMLSLNSPGQKLGIYCIYAKPSLYWSVLGSHLATR